MLLFTFLLYNFVNVLFYMHFLLCPANNSYMYFIIYFSPKIVRYFSVATMAAMLMYIRFSGKRSESDQSTKVIFMHLLTFAAHFGAQFWVTFIAGKKISFFMEQNICFDNFIDVIFYGFHYHFNHNF